MAYADFKDLRRKKASDKVLRDKVFDIAKNSKHDGYQRGLASMIYKLFDKKTSGGAVKNGIMSNQESAEELHKPVIKKIEKQKVYLSIKSNIWGADLVDMQLISKLDKGFWLLLCVIDIYSKYAWVFPLKDKKGNTITNSYKKN